MIIMNVQRQRYNKKATSGLTSIDASIPDSAALAECVGYFLNLLSQFSGGGENENDGAVASVQRGLVADMDHTGQQKLRGMRNILSGEKTTWAPSELREINFFFLILV